MNRCSRGNTYHVFHNCMFTNIVNPKIVIKSNDSSNQSNSSPIQIEMPNTQREMSDGFMPIYGNDESIILDIEIPV